MSAGGARRLGSGAAPHPRRVALTQAHVEHVLHGVAWLCVEDAPTHAQPDDGHLGDHAAQQDAQVAAAVVHQVQGTGLVWVVDQAEEHHGQDHKPVGRPASEAKSGRCACSQDLCPLVPDPTPQEDVLRAGLGCLETQLCSISISTRDRRRAGQGVLWVVP